MKYRALGVVLFLLAVAPVADGQPAEPKPYTYVGEIIIVGNNVTQDWVIRRQLGFYPGQVLDPSELKKAEKRIAQLGLFKCDPGRKIGPTVQVLANEGAYKDILVKVEESTVRRTFVDASVDSTGGPIIRFMVEDRNFDLFGFPASIADIDEGKAFRGAGQKVRFELVRINLLQAKVAFFADGQLLPIVLGAILE